MPCSFGVLTVDSMEQALARAGGDKRDSGRHAAEAVLALLKVKAQLCADPGAAVAPINGAVEVVGQSWMLAGIGEQRRLIALALIVTLAVAISLVTMLSTGEATSGGSPYAVPDVVDTNPDPNIVETTLTADEATVDIGQRRQTANAQTFNGTIPGPTFRLKVGDTVIVHYENQLDQPSAHPLARHRAAERDGRHAVHAEPGRARRQVPLQVQGHPAGDLLVPPAPPLVDQPGLQGPLRDDHRRGPERGRAARLGHAAAAEPTPSRSCSAT